MTPKTLIYYLRAMVRIEKKYGSFISEWEMDVMKLQWKMDEIETAVSEAIRNSTRDIVNVELQAHVEGHLSVCKVDKIYLNGSALMMSVKEDEDIFNDVPFKLICRPEEKLKVAKKVFDILEAI